MTVMIEIVQKCWSNFDSIFNIHCILLSLYYIVECTLQAIY